MQENKHFLRIYIVGSKKQEADIGGGNGGLTLCTRYGTLLYRRWILW